MVSQFLIWLFENNKIDGAIVAKFDISSPLLVHYNILMLYKTKNNCIHVVSHTARYDYAYLEVRGELVCRGTQTADQDCEVRQYAGGNHPESHHPSCGRQEWETAYDCARGCHSLRHVCHYSSERQDSLWGEGTRRNHSAKETGDTASRGQGYRRRQGSYHSSRLRRFAQGI